MIFIDRPLPRLLGLLPLSGVAVDCMRTLLGVPCVAWVEPALCTLAALERTTGLVLSRNTYTPPSALLFSLPPPPHPPLTRRPMQQLGAGECRASVASARHSARPHPLAALRIPPRQPGLRP